VPEKKAEPKFNEQEINGKFKITSLKWNDKLSDPSSVEYEELSNSIEDSLESMLNNESDLAEQVAEFTVEVQRFTRGSVVCDFKVNYVLKEAYVAIPFAIKPTNITDAMGKNFKFKKGILFQRFLIAADSFKASAPVDHCAAKGCSHKCNYDYDLEDYFCTCPRTLTLDIAQRNCISPDEAEAEKATTTESVATENVVTVKPAEENATDKNIVENEAVDEETADETNINEGSEQSESTTKETAVKEATTEGTSVDEATTEEAGDDKATSEGAGDDKTTTKEAVAKDDQAETSEDGETLETTTATVMFDDVDSDVTTVAAVDSTLDQETTTAAYEDFGPDAGEEAEDTTTQGPQVEGSGSAEADIAPSFGDRMTTTEPGMESITTETSTTLADSETADADTTDDKIDTTDEETDTTEKTDEDTTTEQEIQPTESSMPIGSDTSEPSNTTVPVPGTTSLPDIMKSIPEIIDEAINDLFGGVTAGPEETEGAITADPIVITVEEAEATTTAPGIEFATDGPIAPLDDPNQTGDEETLAEGTTVSIEEFTAMTPEDPEILDQEAEAKTDAPVTDDATTPKVQPEKMPRIDASNEGQVPATTVTPDGETGGEDDEAGPVTAQPTGDAETTTKQDDTKVQTGTTSETTTMTAVPEDSEVETNEDDTEGSTSDETEVTTFAPTVVSIEETEDGITIVTTIQPDSVITVTTVRPGDATTIAGPTVPAQEGETTTKVAESDSTEDTTLKTENDESSLPSDAVTTDTSIEGDATTPKSVSDTTMPKTDADTTTPKPDTTDLPVDNEVQTSVSEGEDVTTDGTEVTTMSADTDTTTEKTDIEVITEEADSEMTTQLPSAENPDRSLLDESTTSPKEEEAVTEDIPEEGSANDMPDEVTTGEPVAEVTSAPKDSEAETAEPQETEVTSIVPTDSEVTTVEPTDSEVTTISQKPPALGPATKRANSEGTTTTAAPEDGQVTTTRPTDAVVTLLTTIRPGRDMSTETPESQDKTESDTAAEATTLAPEDGGMHEFDCTEITDAELAFAAPDQIPLECRLRSRSGVPRTVFIMIPKQGLDTTRLFDRNVKVVVKDLMIMDISPKRK